MSHANGLTNGHANGRANGHANGDGGNRIAAFIADRLPPQNLEAERGVLGSFLLDGATIDEVMFHLDPGEFYRDAHEILCRGVYDLHSGGSAVDSITLEDRLRREGTLDRAGGLDYILEVLAGVPHAANARYYAQIVKEKAVARRVIAAGNAMVRAGYSGNMTADEMVEAAGRDVFALGECGDRRGATEASAEAAGVIADIDRMRATGVVPGVPFGWPDVDEITGGLRGGQLVIVAARPSMGKTSYAVQAAVNIADSPGLPSLFVSLEMGRAGIATRMLSLVSEIALHHLRNPRGITEAHLRKLGEAQAWMRDRPPVLLEDAGPLTASRIAASARRHRARSGIGIVFVDYLQLVAGSGEGDSRQEAVAAISAKLKALALELDVPVVALSQLNRKAEERDDRRPRMADLRESGALEQDADLVLLLHRPEYYDPNDQPGVAEVIVAKNRDGPTGTAKLCFRRELTCFDSLAQADGVGAF